MHKRWKSHIFINEKFINYKAILLKMKFEYIRNIKCVEPELRVETKIGHINERCMCCFKLIYPNKAYLVRLNFSRVYGGRWRVCDSCFRKLFNPEFVEKALKEMGEE